MPKGYSNNIEETNKKKSESHKGKPSGMLGKSAWNKGLTKETNEIVKSIAIKVSKTLSNKYKRSKLYNWKGGLSDYYHGKARELFGTNYCEECGISKEEYRKTHKVSLSMHCITKDYKILEQFNWMCLCQKDHSSLQNQIYLEV